MQEIKTITKSTKHVGGGTLELLLVITEEVNSHLKDGWEILTPPTPFSRGEGYLAVVYATLIKRDL